jgi:hypothetical protein
VHLSFIILIGIFNIMGDGHILVLIILFYYRINITAWLSKGECAFWALVLSDFQSRSRDPFVNWPYCSYIFRSPYCTVLSSYKLTLPIATFALIS